MPLAHLDRPFDYLVPQALSADAVPGVRVKVRFAGQLVDGWLLERTERSDHPKLAYLDKVVSAVPVLAPEVARLARVVADRYAGSLADVLRLAVATPARPGGEGGHRRRPAKRRGTHRSARFAGAGGVARLPGRPAIVPTGDDPQLARDPGAATARLPSLAWTAATPVPGLASRLRASVTGARRTAEELGRGLPGVPVRTPAGRRCWPTSPVAPVW